MILILTYHKVASGLESQPRFYTVSSEQFERQLESLERSSLKALMPKDLLNPNSGSQGYLLTFDDGTSDHCEVVLPLLEQYQRRAIFFIPTAKLDRPGYLTGKQAGQISRAGHTLGLHGHEHKRLDLLSEEDIRVQMEISQEKLSALSGQPPLFFAPVGGYVNSRVQNIALESGVKVIRTMRWGYNKRLDRTNLQCIPVNRRFNEKEFGQVLALRNRSLLYVAKEMTKKLLPSRAYELLRGAVSGSSRQE